MQVLSAGGVDEPQSSARAGDEWHSLPVDTQPMALGGKDAVSSLYQEWENASQVGPRPISGRGDLQRRNDIADKI
jgi:hypothetical protein